MKYERRIEKFLKRIDVVPDSERKRLRLQELLETRDKNKRLISAELQPSFRRIIMNRRIWKITASLVVAVTVIGVIGILQNGNQAAYAFAQTITAMQNKQSFHIQTYYNTPTRVKDEFWAEFNGNGKVISIRQAEWLGQSYPQVQVIWKNGIKYQYELDDKRKERGEPGILLISRKEHHVDEDDLEEFDPERIMELLYSQIENGDAAIEVNDTITHDGNIIVKVTENNSQRLKVLIVDPETDLVLRMDTYEPYDPNEHDENGSYIEGKNKYLYGIKVLEYNRPLDTNTFQPNLPADTIIVDQTSGDVGMAQGDLSDKDIAEEIVRQALEAWAADDYKTAGLLFGGAPKEYFVQRTEDKPQGEIVVGEPEWYPLEPNRPRYRIVCSYVAEREGRLIKTKGYYFVTTVSEQPGRWFITPVKL